MIPTYQFFRAYSYQSGKREGEYFSIIFVEWALIPYFPYGFRRIPVFRDP